MPADAAFHATFIERVVAPVELCDTEVLKLELQFPSNTVLPFGTVQNESKFPLVIDWSITTELLPETPLTLSQ